MRHLLGVVFGISVLCAQAQVPVLVYNGASEGDWFASGVWLDEAGQAADWSDGSVAVITNRSITLTADASVHGFRVSLNGKYVIRGAGKLTLGAGGIATDTGGEFNIQCSGGLHLAASQEWVRETTGDVMFCLDGRHPLTSAPGVVLTVNNGVLRNNAGGGLTDQCTIVLVGANGRLSPASDPAALGENKLVLEGPGSHFTAAGDTSAFFGIPSTGSELLLNNGASIVMVTSKQYRLPVLTVASPTGTVSSTITGGGELSLTNASTELLIQSGATLNISPRLTNGPNGASAVRKTGLGTLIFSGAQAFSGGLSIDAGRVATSAQDGLGAGAVTLASGTMLELMSNANIANAIGGAGALIKTGNGTATLTGANTYTGGTTLQDGTVRVNALDAFGTGNLALNDNTVAFMSNITLLPSTATAAVLDTGTFKAENGVTLTWDGDYPAAQAVRLAADPLGNVIVNGNLTGSGFVKTDAGKLSIAGTVGYTGDIVVENGILYIGDTSILEAGVTIETSGNGAVQLDTMAGQDLTKITGTKNIILVSGSEITLDTDTTAAPSVAQNNTLTISMLSGSKDLIKTGLGTMVVTNMSNFTGNVLVLEGTLVSETSLGAGQITISNGTFRVNNAIVSNPITLAESTSILSVTNSGSLGAGALSVSVGILRIEEGGSVGSRAVTLSGSGYVQVADGSGFDGGSLTISGGTLEFIANTVLTQAPVLAANCWFRAAPGIAAEINASVDTIAKAKLMVGGGGRITFSGGGNFGYQSEIFVQHAGTEFVVVSNKVVITWYAGLEAGGKLFLIKDGGEVEINGGSGSAVHVGANYNGTSTIEVGEGGTLNVINGTNFRLGYNAGAIGVLRLSGGIANLTNIGNFEVGASGGSTGRVELVSGVLNTSRQLTGGSNGTLMFSGGTLQSDGINSYNPWVRENVLIRVEKDGGTLDVNGLEMFIGGSTLGGFGALTVTGGGGANFNRSSPGWTGGITADGCDIRASVGHALGNGGTVSLGDNTLLVAGNALLPNPIQAADGVIDVGEGLTAQTGIVFGGKITKTGAGEWVTDYVFEDVDLSIQAGQVTVAPVTDSSASQSLAGNPVFWVDAMRTASLTMDGSGNVSRWSDWRTPADPLGNFFASALNNYSAPVWTADKLNGLPVVDFGILGQTGAPGDNRMMQFKDYLENIRTVFWVIGSKNGGGFLLGDNRANGSQRHFHRAAGVLGLHGGQPEDPLWGGSDKGIVRNGETWINTLPVDGATTGLSGGFDLVAWRLNATDDTTNNTAGAIWFASCYAPTDSRLNGGQDLGEVLIFTNRLTDAERRLTEFYLARKWFPDMMATFPVKSVSLDGAGVTFSNEYDTLHVAELIINAPDVSVSGNPMTVDKLTVTGSGELQCERLQTLEVGALELLSGATITVDVDDCPALNVMGNLTLPDTATFRIISATKPPPSLLLIKADSTVTDATPCQWVPAQGTSSASRIAVNATSGEVWLKTAQGTIIILK